MGERESDDVSHRNTNSHNNSGYVHDYEEDNQTTIDLDDDTPPAESNGELKRTDSTEEEEEPRVGFFSLFRFADKLDILLMLCGSLCMVGLGCALPVNIVFFGDLLTEYVVRDWAEIPGVSNATLMGTCSFEGQTGNFTQEFFQDTVVKVYVVAFIGIAIAAFLFGYLGMTFWTWTGNRQIRKIQAAYFQAIMRQSVGWFDTNDSGELNARIVGDVERLNDGFGDKMGAFIQWVSTFVGGVALGFAVSWRLMLVVLAACPALVIAGAAMGRLIRTLVREELAAYAKAGTVADETFSSIRTVAAFGGEKKAEEKYIASLHGVLKGSVRKSTASGLTGGLFWFILFGIIGLAFWYGAMLIREECLEPGAIMQVLLGVMFGSMSLGHAAPLLENFTNARTAAASLYKTIDAEVDIDSSSEKGIKPEKINGNIQFSNVHFSYPARKDVKVLDGVNLNVKKGETVALVGESGCGKSTTIQLLQRFYDCAAGQVLIDGRDLRSYNLTSLRNFMGIVSQEPVLFDTTIGENIKLGAKYGDEVTEQQLVTAAKQSNCYDFITKLPKGFNTMVGERGVQLSGGQKQRIAIARALVRNPVILLLDEATSALDTRSESIVQDALDKASKGRTTIVIAHRLSTVRNANRIFAFSKGQVHEEGNHNELMAIKGIYYSLVMRQMQQQKEDEKDIGEDSMIIPTSLKKPKTWAQFEDPLQRRCHSVKQTSRKSGHRINRLGSLKETSSFKSPFGAETNGENMAEMPGSPSSIRSRSLKRSRVASLRRSSRLGSLKEVVDNGFPLGADYSDEIEVAAEELPPEERRVVEQTLSSSESKLLDVPSITGREIMDMNKPEWGLIAIGVVASMFAGAAQPLYLLIITELIGALSIPNPEQQASTVAGLVGYIMLIGAITAIATLVQGFTLGLSGEKLTSRLRKQFFAAILRQDIGYFDAEENGVGQLTSRLTTDAPLVKGATGIRFGIIAQTLTSIAGILIMSFYYIWELALVMLVCLPIVLLAGKIRQSVIEGNVAQDKASIEKGGKIAQEAISNMRTVTSLNRQVFFIDKFYDHFKGLYKKNLKASFTYGIAFAVSASMQFVLYAVCFGLGGYMMICDCLPWRSRPIEFYQIVRVFAAITYGGVATGRIASTLPDYGKASAAAASIKSLLQRFSPIDPTSKQGITPMRCSGKVEFKDVQFHYPTRPAIQVLQGLNFTINKGETVALVGSSGCGKSTSVSLLERFYDVIAGSVLLDGKDVRTLNVQWLRQHIGIVSQEPTLFDATIEENIAYGDNTRDVSIDEIIDAATKSSAHKFISSLPEGYNTNVGAKGTQLSGGQKQRIAIARALIRKPAILLLDEATSALDTESEKIVQEALDEAMKGRSAIVIAHRLSTVRNADKIGVVDNGKIVEFGTHQELLAKKGFYSILVNGQL